MAWHSDNEKALGTHPTIASVTLGQVRTFDIRNKADHSIRYSVKLEHGSLLEEKFHQLEILVIHSLTAKL